MPTGSDGRGETRRRDVAVEKVRECFPEYFRDASTFRGEQTLVIAREGLLPVLQLLRDDPHLRFDFLADLTAVDFLPREPRFDIVYHLKSLSRNVRLRVKVGVPEEDAVIESAVALWPGAEWLEREVFDLFGICFRNHPDLRRILLPDEWEGHPLRKDFPMGKVAVSFTKTRAL